MKRTKINRLWHGLASIRDYIVREAIEKRQDLLIILGGVNERMIIPWQELHKGKKNPEKFKSKHSNKIYSLIDFDWQPNVSQKTLF